ncbi:MAG: GIY-YIG nuclease family protein [bacterium]|nr:GIY-YIG nuclease family protein [bacterium]
MIIGMSEWVVYILLCSDGTLYTGISNRLEHRLESHHGGVASKYTRTRLPVKLVHQERHPNRSSALKREAAIRKLSRSEKQRLARV